MAYTVEEYLKLSGESEGDWTPWRFDQLADALVLDAHDYAVPLTECRQSPDKALSWVLHVTGKAWMTPALALAFLRIFGTHVDPEAFLTRRRRRNATRMVRRREQMAPRIGEWLT